MNIIMPKMGESVNEGTVIKWHKKVGDTVKRDEIIFEISTDKVDTEIPSPSDGILKEILVHEGETVEVGTIVAVLETKDEPRIESKLKEVTEIETKELSQTPETASENASSKTMHAQTEGIVEVIMPKMGESVMEGTIIKWHKKAGEFVGKDETLFEISTDKVDTEIPSPGEGILYEILYAEQQTVEVGTVVARISSSLTNKQASYESVLPKSEIQEKKPVEKIPLSKNELQRVKLTKLSAESARFYSPLVLNIAQKENISLAELENIKGTGIAGRVTKKDILEFLDARKNLTRQKIKSESKITYEAPKEPFETKAIEASDGVQKIEMDNIRLKIMQHMVKSRDTSVHVTGLIEVDMNRIHNFISAKKDDFLRSENIKLTYMPFIAHAAVKALKEFPLINSTIEGTTIFQKKFINLGIAVAIEPTGLIVPNIKDAGDKNLLGLARAISDLALRARSKKLTPDDISNGTFSITNYGVFGTLFGTPIINQPEVAILGVGAIQKKPVVMEIDGVDTIAVKPIMALTLSHDHRLIDGMLGGRFLKFVKDTLENFDGKIF